uniref:Uncharacterized protein n=1 Tax=Anguilla anguilla TaxID=7936 RepID=A0A0E9WVP7_ANGAN
MCPGGNGKVSTSVLCKEYFFNYTLLNNFSSMLSTK